MILSVATTGPPFWAICVGATNVAELVIDDSEVVEDDEVYAVDPESCEEREAWLMVWLNPGALPVRAPLEGKTGAVFVLERGP